MRLVTEKVTLSTYHWRDVIELPVQDRRRGEVAGVLDLDAKTAAAQAQLLGALEDRSSIDSVPTGADPAADLVELQLGAALALLLARLLDARLTELPIRDPEWEGSGQLPLSLTCRIGRLFLLLSCPL